MPVVNAVFALLYHPPPQGWQPIQPQFYLGIILAAAGGLLVTLYKPLPNKPTGAPKTAAVAGPSSSQNPRG